MTTGKKAEPAPAATVRVLFSPGNVWRAALVVVGVLALAMFLRFVLTDAGSFLFLVVIAWFLSLAMEPHGGQARAAHAAWRRGRGGDGRARPVRRDLPGAVRAALRGAGGAAGQGPAGRAGRRDGVGQPAVRDELQRLRHPGIGQADAPGGRRIRAGGVLAGVLGVLGTVAGMVFNIFALMLLTFYLSADGPRARQWLARRLPGRFQQVFTSVWDISLAKTGGYVAARVILSLINSTASTIVFLALGMPSWLALGVWTGVVAQFVPTIGTYIAIALPVVVGLVSDRPWIGLAALAWGILYQQVENLTLEPRISAWGGGHPSRGLVLGRDHRSAAVRRDGGRCWRSRRWRCSWRCWTPSAPATSSNHRSRPPSPKNRRRNRPLSQKQPG
ncbi:AI-2E family transporter [Nonomuraea ferruginea]